jgi:uncharacterized protein
MSKQHFISMPVRDLARSTAFYVAMGATRNPQFSDESSSCMVFSEHFFVMLLTHEKWSTFTDKPIVDSRRESEVMVGIICDSRKAVDDAAAAAAAHGGRADVSPPTDLPFMYSRGLEDPDGHACDAVFMDMTQFPKEQPDS